MSKSIINVNSDDSTHSDSDHHSDDDVICTRVVINVDYSDSDSDHDDASSYHSMVFLQDEPETERQGNQSAAAALQSYDEWVQQEIYWDNLAEEDYQIERMGRQMYEMDQAADAPDAEASTSRVRH